VLATLGAFRVISLQFVTIYTYERKEVVGSKEGVKGSSSTELWD
jgi:hypothetical protein